MSVAELKLTELTETLEKASQNDEKACRFVAVNLREIHNAYTTASAVNKEKIYNAYPQLFDLYDKLIPTAKASDPCDYERPVVLIYEMLTSNQNLVNVVHNVIELLGTDKECKLLDDRGCYSIVYKIGDYVLKLGRKRFSDKVPNTRLWANPLLQFAIYNKAGRPLFIIEVQRELEPIHDIKNLDYKYDLVRYVNSKLYASGLVWDDDKIKNLGLLKDGDKNPQIIPAGHGLFSNRPEVINKKQDDEIERRYRKLDPALRKRVRIIDIDFMYHA